MPEQKKIVINTGPTLALIAGLGDLCLLNSLYDEVVVPYEVCQELKNGGSTGFGIEEFHNATFLTKAEEPAVISPFLRNTLDSGEASVIQTALDKGISTVCIDEAMGRRIARLNGLSLTGSLGIVIRAKLDGQLSSSLQSVIDKMETQGIYLSTKIIAYALEQVGE